MTLNPTKKYKHKPHKWHQKSNTTNLKTDKQENTDNAMQNAEGIKSIGNNKRRMNEKWNANFLWYFFTIYLYCIGVVINCTVLDEKWRR